MGQTNRSSGTAPSGPPQSGPVGPAAPVHPGAYAGMNQGFEGINQGFNGDAFASAFGPQTGIQRSALGGMSAELPGGYASIIANLVKAFRGGQTEQGGTGMSLAGPVNQGASPVAGSSLSHVPALSGIGSGSSSGGNPFTYPGSNKDGGIGSSFSPTRPTTGAKLL